MDVFEVEIVSERDQRCVRRVEFLASHTLWDVHCCIQREFDLDNGHVWSFHLSGEYHDPDTEFGGTPLDGGTAANARLGELDLQEGMAIAYVFDFGDELRHPLRVVRISERQPGMEYPRVTFRAGTPPPQYRFEEPGPEDDELEGDECEASALEDVESGDAGSGEVARSVSEARSVPDHAPSLPADLIEKVRRAMNRESEPDDEEAEEGGIDHADLAAVAAAVESCTTEEQLIALCEAVGRDVFPWIATVLARGVTAGRADEMEPLAARFARTAPDTRHQLLWATALLRTGRRDEALAAMASYRPANHPESIRHRIRTATLLSDAGDDAAAEEQLRALLELRWLSRNAREETVRALAPILRRSGRGAEATRMLDELAAKRMARLLGKPMPARRIAPKVGRNDPCPCGSGRKYKKCCGSALR